MTTSRRLTSEDLGPMDDVDLDEAVVYSDNGERLTERGAAEIADRALRRVGRPSVSRGRRRTPNMSLRVPVELREQLEKIADAQGRRLADVGRDALSEYARRHRV